MSRKLYFGVAALVAFGFAGPAMAQQLDGDSYNVNVNIEVAANVSMWAGHQDVSLVLDGGPVNDDYFASSISHINNIPANISVTVNGDFPTPGVGGGGVIFYLFPNQGSVAAAKAAVALNNYGPAGALVWTDGQEGITKPYGPVGIATSIANQPVVYGAGTPGELPVPQDVNLDVVWDIAPTTTTP